MRVAEFVGQQSRIAFFAREFIIQISKNIDFQIV
jgi:hypothetical protein